MHTYTSEIDTAISYHGAECGPGMTSQRDQPWHDDPDFAVTTWVCLRTSPGPQDQRGEAQSEKSNSGQGCEQMWLIHENGRLIAPLNWVSLRLIKFRVQSVAQAGRVVKTSKEHPPA
ncbi:MAG: hypothetical protein CM15mP120_21370 [Pseudomonadota bacterium]|nr:MAG: hypothetical protein CM15mP120_21370 [Pseudomonadota bacterium]